MSIDWQALHARLKKNQSLLTEDEQPDVKTSKAILKARAALLAREAEQTDEQLGNFSVVAFELAGEHFAFELKHVHEIVPLMHFAAVPCTPAFIYGIINLRGQILTVIDMRKLLDMPAKEPSHLSRVILLQSSHTTMGVIADKLLGISTLDVSTLQPSLSGFSGLSSAYLKGISSDQIVVLDALKILKDTNIVVNERV